MATRTANVNAVSEALRDMPSSVTLSIATNSAIAAARGFGWFGTGSSALFAETVHSLADVGNQLVPVPSGPDSGIPVLLPRRATAIRATGQVRILDDKEPA